MFQLPLFRIRAFTFGTLSTFLSAVARGGLMFMLIIWLQGIWLPAARLRLHRDAAVGRHLHAAADGRDADRRADVGLSCRTASARAAFATGGMLGAALSFGLLLLLPIDFPTRCSRPILLLNGALDGDVRLAQPRGGDEQPAAGATAAPAAA